MKTDKDVNKYMRSLSDTDLGLGIATILTELLNKLPLGIKMSHLKDEVEVAEVSLRELQRRLKERSKKDGLNVEGEKE